MGLFQRVPQGLYFFSVLLLDPCDLAGQRVDEGALFVCRRSWCGCSRGSDHRRSRGEQTRPDSASTSQPPSVPLAPGPLSARLEPVSGE